MNCFKWDDTDQTEQVKTETSEQDIAAMISSVQLSSTPCPSSSSNIPPFLTSEQPQKSDIVYPIETIVSTYTTPMTFYKHTSQHSSPRNSPEFMKRFASETRYWEDVKRPKKNSSNINGISFVVMSYNILAQALLEDHSYLYRNSPKECLEWNNRWKRLKDEIRQQKPNIICLQEVETSYLNLIGTFLNSSGYKGIFKQKTGTKVDGCAVFFKSNEFDVVDYQSVEYMQPGSTILNRDNIGIMVKLSSKSNKELQFVVCTTHLLYNPKRTDVRLAQMQLFLAEIDRFSYRENANNEKSEHLPVILTGDLNSFPNTPVTNLIDRGNVNVEGFFNLYDVAITNACQHLEIYLERLQNTSLPNAAASMLYHSEIQKAYKKPLIEQRYSFEEYRHLFQNNFIRHHLNFTSAYDHVKKNGEMEVTTHQNNWVTVDYIYYSSSSSYGQLEVTERYRLPTSNECRDIGGIPNNFYGSDHFALAAKFILTPPDEKEKTETSL